MTRGLIYGAKLTLTRNVTTYYVKQNVTLTRNVKPFKRKEFFIARHIRGV